MGDGYKPQGAMQAMGAKITSWIKFRYTGPMMRLLPIFLLLATPMPAASEECKEVERLEAYFADRTAISGATCTGVLLTEGRRGVSCYWTHPFRNMAATEQAEALWTRVQACRSGYSVAADPAVNHPDSFVQRAWQTEKGLFTVSVIDKAALASTLVWFGLQE